MCRISLGIHSISHSRKFKVHHIHGNIVCAFDDMNTFPGQCLNGGVRTENGVCVHGFLIELLKLLVDKLIESGDDSAKSWGDVSIWYTNSTITKVQRQ